MADLLIRGMEMPKTCFECPFFVVFYKKQMGICTAFGDGTNREKMSDRKKETGRMSGCPLVELPPHGDLIDRDALKHKFCTHCDGYEHDTGACVDGDQDCMDAKIIMTASVIVPSNKEEGD